MAKRKRKAMPLAPPPAMRSRKKARLVTTLFHKYTKARDLAEVKGDPFKVQEMEAKIMEIGGRDAYQRASQLSTSFHSTSKWVLGHLSRNGWLYGIENDEASTERGRKKGRRQANVLEVGAINTELLDAAKLTKRVEQESENGESTFIDAPKYRLCVKAIDLKSSHAGIEEADFNHFPLKHEDPTQRYDVIVCSMVINCVTTPEQRGVMLTRLYHQLCPGGLCFFTLPRLCLNQSPYTSTANFQDLLKDGVGFDIVEIKNSPKISFYILKRPTHNETKTKFNPKWAKLTVINRGTKFRNTFGVVLEENQVTGASLH